MVTNYELQCLSSGAVLRDDTSLPLSYAGAAEPAFLRTMYGSRQLNLRHKDYGLYQYADWLPLQRTLAGSSAPVTYRSEGLANELGLDNLYVTFSGYWPERDVRMKSGTFKECEAFSVLARVPEGFPDTLVVASAGNTARAFIRACSHNEIPLVVVVPEDNLDTIWNTTPPSPSVKVIAVSDGADYFDAIRLAGHIAELDGYSPEGGAKNVARRDGMGTTVLSAVTTIGQVPDYYFQAVGSGTGAIAAWEANQRFIRDGRFGNKRMRLMLSQNSPFLVLHDSWKRGSRELVTVDGETARQQVAGLYARVLSNRQPPYSVRGGVYDALAATNGDIMAVANEEAIIAGSLFERTEGIDITPAAAVSVASLVEATRRGTVKRDDLIMLNITGGGLGRLFEEQNVYQITPSRVISRNEIDARGARELMDELASDGSST
jgi:cysteate synthase